MYFFFFSIYSYAHKGEDHSKPLKEKVEISVDKLKLINESYKKNVASIFKAKCLDCHGTPKKLPWYYALPIAKQMMDKDMKEAKKHLDIQKGFPFKGHGTPEEDLKAISEVIEKKEMPPLNYRMMHWNSEITKDEAKVIKKWVNESLASLDKE